MALQHYSIFILRQNDILTLPLLVHEGVETRALKAVHDRIQQRLVVLGLLYHEASVSQLLLFLIRWHSQTQVVVLLNIFSRRTRPHIVQILQVVERSLAVIQILAPLLLLVHTRKDITRPYLAALLRLLTPLPLNYLGIVVISLFLWLWLIKKVTSCSGDFFDRYFLGVALESALENVGVSLDYVEQVGPRNGVQLPVLVDDLNELDASVLVWIQ